MMNNCCHSNVVSYVVVDDVVDDPVENQRQDGWCWCWC
jgi:aminopeptidase C